MSDQLMNIQEVAKYLRVPVPPSAGCAKRAPSAAMSSGRVASLFW